jgi:hypothetical protein
MAKITIREQFTLNNVLTDVTSIVLSNAAGTIGIKRNDTGAAVVADGTPFVKISTGVYEYEFNEPEDGLLYTVYIEYVYNGDTYRKARLFNSSAQAPADSTQNTTIETAIYSILTGNADVAALVFTQVYPNILPQNTALPAIVYQQVSGVRDYTSDGADGLVNSRYQLNCFANTYAKAKELFEAVRKAVSGYVGWVNGREIKGIFVENEEDIPNLIPEAEQITMYGKKLDAVIWFEESLV